MPKLPDDFSLGARPAATAARPSVNPRGAASGYATAANIYSRDASQAGAGLLNIGESIGEVGDLVARGEERIRLREEALHRAEALGQLNEAADAELKRILKEDDIGSIGANKAYSEFLAQKREELVKGHPGSVESRLQLETQLVPVEHSYAGRAAALAFESQQKKVDIQLGGQLNSLTAEAYNPGSDLVTLMRSWDAHVANFANTMTADQERAQILGGREKLAEAKITSFLFRGVAGVDHAETLLANPRLTEVLGAGAQARIRGRIAAFQAARAEQMTGPVKGIPRDIWESLPQEKQMEILGPKATAESNMTVEIGDATSPTGTRIIPRSMVGQEMTPEVLARYPPGKPPSGLNIEMEDGRVKSITTGRQSGADGAMSKKSQATVEEKLFSAREGLARLDQVQQTFKPEYQTFETRMGTAWTALKEKAGRDIPEGDRKQLEEFSTYRRESIDNINRYIKEITGAQMSEAEADRLRKAMPDPGEGIFDGDSPTEFKAKMEGTIKSLRLSTARYAWALQHGLDPLKTNMTFELTEKLMADRIKEIAAELEKSSPKLAPELRNRLIRQRIGQEFGLY